MARRGRGFSGGDGDGDDGARGNVGSAQLAAR
jgi:hypothetical protein